MNLKSHSFVVDGKGGHQVREFKVPDIDDEGLVMAVELCGICGGGDTILYQGKHPHAKYPLVLGHEMVGRVAAIGKNASKERGLKEGDRFVVEVVIPCWRCAMCRSGNYQLCVKEEQYGVSRPATDGIGIWGGYGNYMMIDPRSITHKMDDSVPVERAVAIAVLANGARWCLLGCVTIGEWVVIQGPGAQGIGSAAVAKTMGANVIVTGIAKDRERLEFVKKMGADYAICIDEEDAVERVKEITGGRMADVVLENSGAPAAVPQGLELCGRKARYVLSGYSKKASVEIVKDLIALKELEVIGGWGQAGGFRAGNQVINEGRFKFEDMVTNHFTVENAHEGVEKVISGEIALKAVVHPIEG